MSDVVVRVAALRAAAAALGAEDGPIAFLRNAQAELHGATIGAMGLTLFGMSTARAHDAALQVHDDNLRGGIESLRSAAEKLNVVASNWERSDQPWVVKG